MKRLLIIFVLFCFPVLLQAQVRATPYYSRNTSGATLLTDIWGYWKMDESTGINLNDMVSTNDGTVYGATVNVAGKIGKAVSFDGTNDYVTIPTAAQPTGTSYAISIWFNLHLAPANAGYIFAFKTTNDGDARTRFFLDAARKINGYVYDSALGWVEIFYNSALTLDAWYHLVVNVPGNGQPVKVWLDGVNVVTTGNLANTPGYANGVIVLGDGSFNGTYRPLNGLLDEMLIMNRDITDVEIAWLWKDGDGRTYPLN